MSRGRINFSGDEAQVPEESPLGPLWFTLAAVNGEIIEVDCSDLPNILPVRQIISAFREWAESRRFYTSNIFYASQGLATIKFFLTWLIERERVSRLSQLSPAHIDRFEAACIERWSGSSRVRRLGLMLLVLSFLPEHLLAADTHVRISYRSVTLSERRPTPRDAYSAFIAEQLRAGCRAALSDVVNRLTNKSVLEGGEDPRTIGIQADGRALGWRMKEHVLWEMAQRGPLAVREWRARSGWRMNPGEGWRLTELNSALFPSSKDLIPFLLLLMLETGIPPAGVLDLRTNCLRNTANGRSDLVYYKARARKTIIEAVRDRGPFTPGGIIRAAIAITERLRPHFRTPNGLPSDHLWIALRGEGGCGPTRVGALLDNRCKTGSLASFCRTIGLVDDEGKPFLVKPARLRKTHKAIYYKRTRGQLEDLAHDHTPRVAIQHYANIPALLDTFEETIEDGLRDALESAVGATVLTPREEDEAARDIATVGKRVGLALPVLQRVLSGESDVWLASCTNFFQSPWAPAGKACPVSAWGCLGCSNAVITSRKLPAILSFLNYLLREREVMDAGDWALKYAEPYQRIMETILPRFPRRTLVEATALAETRENLLYIPPELRGSI